MDIKDFITKYHTHPVLFFGTGMSMRYLQKSYSWKSLLQQITVDLTGNDELYLNIDSRFNSNCPKMASEIEKIFNQKLEEDRDGKFKDINDLFFDNKRKGIDNSRFKIYISQLLAENSFKAEMLEEIKALKTIRKNISSVITTNYDNLVEQIFQFDPLVGNNILMSNPYGAVYKIHGSIENPSSIIITAEDYKKFDTKYELIRAQLLSLFMHNPIIFMGYSLTDENIKKLLHTIFSYVNSDSETAENIRNNFLIIERDEGNENTEVIPFDIIVDDKNIRVNKIKTDNFTAIYQALSELRLPISAMDIRKVQDIVADIYKGANGIKVEITEDLATLKNSDKVLAIGSDKTIRYQYQTYKELMVNYFSVIEEADEQRLSLIDKYKINTAQYFPIYGFCKINQKIEHEATLKKNQDAKIATLKNTLENNKSCHNEHTAIQDILDDDDIKPSYKMNAIAYSVLVKGKVCLDDLEKYLREYEEKNTDYNKLLVVFDYLKYRV